MKKLLLGAVAASALVCGGSAWAADMPIMYKAAPAPAGYDWTGLYFGGHVGGGWESVRSNDDSHSVLGLNGGLFNPSGAAANMNSSGSSFLGGVQAGTNYQIGRLVLGSELDWSWTSLSSRATGGYPFGPGILATGSETFSESTKWIGTATTRLGVARDNWLFYSKAGAAWAGSTYSLAGVENFGPFATTLGGTFSHMRTGWTVGTGIEWGWTQNWTLKLEYDYINLGTATETMPVGGVTFAGVPYGGTVAANVSQSISEVKFGINYKLSPGFLFW